MSAETGGPRRPPRPARPPAELTETPAPSRRPSAPAPAPAPRARRAPIPDAPGPRPPRRERPVPQLPRATTSSVTFRPSGSVPVVGPPTAEPAVPPADPVPPVDDAPPAVSPLPAAPSPRTAFRKRYGVVYDTQGPRLRLAVLWMLAVAGALAFEPLRPYGLATLYAVVAGAAALQVVDAWHEVRTGGDRWVAALGASSLPVLTTEGVRPLGLGLLALVVVAVVVAFRRGGGDLPPLAAAGHTVLAAGLCGGAASALVLLAEYEIGAVIILVTYLMVYDASDYLVGSGATNGVEGPLAGALFIAAVTCVLAVTEVPPFRGVDVWSFALLAVVACPAGQLLASAMLPRADAPAPALRRLDSALVVAPAWAGLIGLYLQRVAT